MLTRRSWVVYSLFAVAGFILSGLAQPQLIGQDKAKESGTTQWEYKVLGTNATDEKQLNERGEQGWELSAAVSTASSGRIYVYFKRQK